jgi:hypothetical protein
LNYMPEFIEYNNKKIHKSEIKDNIYIGQIIDKI